MITQTMHDTYDIIIVGGGLAGLTLALQLKQSDQSLSIFVAEKKRSPAPDARHKVGESSVEISSHYFRNVLGLENQLAEQLPKYGLRFYFSNLDNRNIEDRVELGANTIPQFGSYQIDRGRFENALLKKCQTLGIDASYDMLVNKIDLGEHKHKVTIKQAGKTNTVSCRWLVDTSGRMALLKRKLNLHKNSHHHINAAWFRIDKIIDINTWSSNESWKNRVSISRHLGTNHLVGKGYWVWLIPLCSGATSIGIVADARFHSYQDLNSYQKAINWLYKYEPQCAEMVSQQQPLDFLTLEHLAHNCKQLYSHSGWFIGGDACVFADPLYSSGNDFIAINNTLITDLIIRQQQGEEIDDRLNHHQNLVRKLFLGFSQVYENQYQILDNARIMTIKIIWDFSLYWGGVALIFIQNKLSNHEFMTSTESFLQSIYSYNSEIQGLLRVWHENTQHNYRSKQQFINYSSISFLQVLNEKLLQSYTNQQLTIELAKNLQILSELVSEIRFKVYSECPQLITDSTPVKSPGTNHFQSILQAFTSDLQSV